MGAGRGGAGGGGINPTTSPLKLDNEFPCNRDSISARRCLVSV